MNWVKALFKRFESIFLQKWTDQFHSAAALRAAHEEWSAGLDGVTGDELAVGLDVCRKQMIWPPSIAEFRTSCLGAKGGVHGSAAYKDFVSLPKPVCDKAVGSAALRGMRSGLV